MNSCSFEIMKVRNYGIFEIHAAYCRALASPKRLAILACLERSEMSVGELASALGASMSTVSRHLTVMKDKHLVISRQEGTRVFYRVADPRLSEACGLIRTVLFDGMRERGELAQGIGPEEIFEEE